MSRDLLELEIAQLEKRGINRYKAVLMASQEANYLNDQIRLGVVKATDKPTTMALTRLFDGMVVEQSEENR